MTVNGLEGRGFLLLIIGVELHSDSVVSYMLMGGSRKRKADGIHALNQQNTGTMDAINLLPHISNAELDPIFHARDCFIETRLNQLHHSTIRLAFLFRKSANP